MGGGDDWAAVDVEIFHSPAECLAFHLRFLDAQTVTAALGDFITADEVS